MKPYSTLLKSNRIITVLALVMLFIVNNSNSQITVALGNPSQYVYGLTRDGQIIEMDVVNGNTHATIKNTNYSPSVYSSILANGLAFSPSKQKFYYFKRNFDGLPTQFVSFAPLTGTVTLLAAPTITAKAYTGCISADGNGYYTFDSNGSLHYYDITNNTWRAISSDIVDNTGADVDAIMRDKASGDIAIDANGNLWIVVSNAANYGIYKLDGPLPTTSKSQLTVTKLVAPTTPTPAGNVLAGIAFSANGKVYMSSWPDGKLYILQNLNTLTYVTTLANSDAASDLTSLNFPQAALLPVTWLDFRVSQATNDEVVLTWKVTEKDNTGFYIQTSANGTGWTNIGFIKSRNNNQGEETYSYNDKTPAAGKNYYRIKQVDIDGKETFSAIRALTISATGSAIAIWPNPAKATLYVTNNLAPANQKTNCQFYDLSGRLSLEKQLQPGTNRIDINSLEAGTYIVRMSNGEGETFSQKIIKQ